MNKRLFLALDISAQDKKQIANWRSQHADFAYKPVRPDNFHITLAFLGLLDSNTEQALINNCNQLASSKPIITNQSLVLSELGYFKKPKVLYLVLAETPNWLSYMATAIDSLASKLSISLEQRAYLPHLTLYRKAYDQEQSANLAIEVNSFSLYHSYSTDNGVRYQRIASWPLFSQQLHN